MEIMTTSSLQLSGHIGLILIVAAIAALAGCAPAPAGRPAIDGSANEKAGTAVARARTITDFSAALRCMDTLLIDYGTGDLGVVVEDLAASGERVNAITKEWLISVVSDMTQRSRAIRIVASGKDPDTILNSLPQPPKHDLHATDAQFALRGTISHVAGTGADTHSERADAESDSRSIVNIDLAILTTRDLSAVPGVATRNSVVLSRPGKAEISKFGVSFNLSTDTGKDVAQAMRALMELALIEAFGRLAKVPYWTCLGVAGTQEGVAAEIQGWYDLMARHPNEITRYFQVQLRTRRLYDGPIDGTLNPELKDAVARYHEALGLPGEARLSLEFFKAYLGANHHQIEANLGAAPAIAIPLKPADATPLNLRIATVNGASQFAPGEAIQLRVQPSRDAHVYCFLQDENRRIIRFFPNRFQPDSRVHSATGLQLPGSMRFEISMNRVGVIETVSCMSTERDILQDLPAALGKGDFVALPVATLEQLRKEFVKATHGPFAHEEFQFRPKSR